MGFLITIIFLLTDFDEYLPGYKFNVPIKTVFDPLNGVFGSLQLPTSAGNGWVNIMKANKYTNKRLFGCLITYKSNRSFYYSTEVNALHQTYDF